MQRSRNIISSLKRKILCGLVVITLIVLALSGYWLKSRIGINFFGKYSLSKYFPFNYLAPNKIIADQVPGIILDDSFDSYTIFGNWSSLWMREKGTVTKNIGPNGRKNSRSLIITSSSTKSWSCSHKNFLQVKKGDVFSFKAAVRLHGENLTARVGVAAFDKNMSVISYNYAKEKTSIINDWILLDKTFTILDNISFVRFRLSGTGIGVFRFDDVYFKKSATYSITVPTI